MADEPMRCAMTGIPIRDPGDGIYDDGEWISWEYIDRQIAIQEGERVEEDFREEDSPEMQWLLMEAEQDEEDGIIPSPKWGHIGEVYVKRRFGVVLSREHAQGHDGRLGNDFVEIKTLTPNKHRPIVRVKRKGNFSILVVVRVNRDHEFDALLVRRDKLPMAGEGDYLYVHWNTLRGLAEPED